jgi:hypothetical protein
MKISNKCGKIERKLNIIENYIIYKERKYLNYQYYYLKSGILEINYRNKRSIKIEYQIRVSVS